MGRFFGVESVVAGIQERGHNIKVVYSMIVYVFLSFVLLHVTYLWVHRSEVKMEQAQYELEKKGMKMAEAAAQEAAANGGDAAGATNPDVFEVASDDETVQAVMSHGIAAMWKMGRIDVRPLSVHPQVT